MKKLIAAALFFVLSTAVALAADFNGKWTADVPGRQGATQTTTFTFKVDGAALTGKVSSGQAGDADITNGKVDGDNITFDVVRSFNGNTVTLTFTGKANADGTIKFSRSVKEMADRPAVEFTAKKAS